MSRRRQLQFGLLALAVLAIAAAALTSAWRPFAVPRPDAVAGGSDSTTVIAALLSENDDLRAEMESLDAEIRQATGGQSGGRLEEMAATLNSLRLVNGAVAAIGPGVEVHLSGDYSAATLRDLVNELKSGGAEAMAIDGRRLTLWSAIYQGRDGILLDGHLLGATVTIQALGDVDTLREVLARRGGLVALLERDGARLDVLEHPGAAEVHLPIAPERELLVARAQ